MVRAGEFRRRAFLRCSAAWFAGSALRGPIAWAGDGPGTEPPIELPFETTPGARFRIVASTFSRFEKDPPDTSVSWERGGMFRQEYEAKVTERDAAGVATVVIESRRGNGFLWHLGDWPVAYDSSEPGEGYRSDRRSSVGPGLVEFGRRDSMLARMSPRADIVSAYNRVPQPGWVAPEVGHRTEQIQRLFLPLPTAPVRPGDAHASHIGVDLDPISSGAFENAADIPVEVRFEGATATFARFTLSGRAVMPSGPLPDHPYFKWIDRIDVEGVVDVERSTGWVLSRDQTMVVAYRDFGRTHHRPRRPGVAAVVNRRRLRVSGSRLP